MGRVLLPVVLGTQWQLWSIAVCCWLLRAMGRWRQRLSACAEAHPNRELNVVQQPSAIADNRRSVWLLQADRSHSRSVSRAVAIARHQTLGRFSDGDEPSRALLACANIKLSQCEDQNGNGRYGQVVVNSLRAPAGTVDVCITLEDSGGRHADELSAHQGAGRIR